MPCGNASKRSVRQEGAVWRVLTGAQKKWGQVNAAEGRKGWCLLCSRNGLKVRFVQNLGRDDAAQERAQER